MIYLFDCDLLIRHNLKIIFLYYISKNLKDLFIMNNLIVSGILVELVIFAVLIYLIKQLQKKQTRQPALSRKIIRNLKL